jgi:hypothetical protein
MDQATLDSYRFLRDMYITRKMSISMISEETGIPKATVRGRLIYLKTPLRTPGEGQKVSGRTGGSGLIGYKFGPMSAARKRKIAAGIRRWADQNANGIRLTSNGYYEITRGPNKGRFLHVVIMEARLGRRLFPDEVVHHIDEKKTNNGDDNLALMTKPGHQRHHRFVQELSPTTSRRRQTNGRYT